MLNRTGSDKPLTLLTRRCLVLAALALACVLSVGAGGGGGGSDMPGISRSDGSRGRWDSRAILPTPRAIRKHSAT
jgi:hypothetical protein